MAKEGESPEPTFISWQKKRADFSTPYTTKAPDVAPMPLIIYIHLSLQTGSYLSLLFNLS